MRICQLALNLDTSSQVILKLCRNLGLDNVKSHRSNISDNEELMLRQLYRAEYMPAPKAAPVAVAEKVKTDDSVQKKTSQPKFIKPVKRAVHPQRIDVDGQKPRSTTIKKPFIKKRGESDNRLQGDRKTGRVSSSESKQDKDYNQDTHRIKKKRKVIIISGELKKVELRDKDYDNNKFKPRRDFKENTEFRKPAKISGFK
ncbi:MAG: hypothetical protein K8S87_10645, partial [Planctomycetes bacterium]|nr:hypothetical protein [Planctomycetota bacterium]